MRHKTDRTKPMTLHDESILKHISLDTSLEPILFCKNTSVIKKNGKHRPRAVVCTELYLYIYKKKKLSKTSENTRTVSNAWKKNYKTCVLRFARISLYSLTIPRK